MITSSLMYILLCTISITVHSEIVFQNVDVPSFLSANKQTTLFQHAARVKDCYSKEKKIHRGIPQGSIVSPHYFNLFMSNLPNCISENALLHQDSTKIAQQSICNTDKPIKIHLKSIVNFLIVTINQL